ncbi:cobalt-precorrin 5A hydrolase [Sulfurospirillum barnesii]|uniref:Cobalamin biosynthesis protein CbiG n=1 Tax=Sulfurospirillum barnesii (strain ATCC 700032 / DSM 10660 / SES-3) TaxID=760154 RepID=I3XZN0_SULBS|nr:cobalamin biosynthesis protein [Sulfurospirillum barnesii]AFL69404.1 cobalamin biosynthesis protein CbiG [Sulfurospirillum barnesii SES-3]
MLSIAILSINRPSLHSAYRLKTFLGDYTVDIYAKKETGEDETPLVYERIEEVFMQGWERYDAFVCLLATGIVVRKIAPLLQSKTSDPAVLVMSLDLSKVIPLLSGHLGGANALSSVIASRIQGCIPFITTATDQLACLAFDLFAKDHGMGIANLHRLAAISNRLINHETIKVFTCKTLFERFTCKENLIRIEESELDENSVVIHPLGDYSQLHLKPKLTLGIGCNRNTPFALIEEAFVWFLAQHHLEKEAIGALASFEAKADEAGLLEFSAHYAIPLHFFTHEEISRATGNFSPSKATQFFGLQGVAEPSALLGSSYQELVIPKKVYKHQITLAGAF